MREFSHSELESGKLSRDWILQAGEAVYAFEDSPAWFRINQLIHEDRKRICGILKQRPSTQTLADYAEASGQLDQLEKFIKYFETITREARKPVESD